MKYAIGITLNFGSKFEFYFSYYKNLSPVMGFSGLEGDCLLSTEALPNQGV